MRYICITAAICFSIFIFRNQPVVERLLAPGYSTCLRCDRPWKFVEPHATDYSESHGMFPLCEKCWTQLGTPEARLPYYRELWYRWESQTPGYANWDDIEKAVMDGE